MHHIRKQSVDNLKVHSEVRGKGRRPGKKKRIKQVQLYLDDQECETLEFFMEFTGQNGYKPMTAGQILKASAVIGARCFGYCAILTDRRHAQNPERDRLEVLNEVLAEAQKRSADAMEEMLIEEIAEQTQLNL